MAKGEAWAAFLREQFDLHPSIRRPIDLVRASGTKENGRPVIDAPRVTAWLKGRNDRPSYDLAVATADAFGVPRDRALAAAGYETGAESVRPAPQDAEPNRLPVGSGIDPELVAGLDPAEVQRVEDFIRGMKAARGE